MIFRHTAASQADGGSQSSGQVIYVSSHSHTSLGHTPGQVPQDTGQSTAGSLPGPMLPSQVSQNINVSQLPAGPAATVPLGSSVQSWANRILVSKKRINMVRFLMSPPKYMYPKEFTTVFSSYKSP